MICSLCGRRGGLKATLAGEEYTLCEYDFIDLKRFLDGRKNKESVNIYWGGGKVGLRCWENLRTYLRKFKITEVLEFGSGLTSELFVNEGIKLTSFDVLSNHIDLLANASQMKELAKFHAYEAGKNPPVEELYPGRTWDFVFVDGPQVRGPEVRTAMRVANKYIYLHDPNLGEQDFFPNEDWIMDPSHSKLFVKKGIEYESSRTGR